MKVFSHLKGSMEGYIQEERLEGFIANEHFKHLGDAGDRVYFSFDPEFVVLADNDEKFGVVVYDAANKDDKAHLDSVKSSLWVLRQELSAIKAKMNNELDMFDVIAGIASKDKYVIGIITALKKEHDDFLTSLGF